MKKVTKHPRQSAAFKKKLEKELSILENERGVNTAILDSSPGFLLHQASMRIKIDLLRKFRETGYDITPEQGMVMNTLWEHEGISQRELADRTLKDGPTITRILDLLEGKKLVSRRPDSSDRRVFKVFLTPDGKDRVETFIAIVSEVDDRAFVGIPAPDRDRFMKILQEIGSNLGA